jgi:ATPase subunit of ABC transporter with duplicated ATPase domains
MIDIAVKNVKKSFEIDKEILSGLTFDVNEGERVGLLGKNGAGKTTLFKIIIGELEADTGEVVIGSGKRIGLISQIPEYPPEYTTDDVLKTSHARQYYLQERLDELNRLMSLNQPVEPREYDALMTEFEALGGYDIDVERVKVANGLDISPQMRQQLFSSLSGGEKTRVNLARLILEKTDILLLDEPTNHLDMNATEWLENYLIRFKGTVLTISHDRYFLDRVVNRIVEIVGGKAEFYGGNYSLYVQEKEARYQEQLKRWEWEQKEAKRLDDAADKLYQWGTGNKKLMHKSFALRTRAERVRQTDRPDRESKMKSRFGEKEFRSDELLVIRGLKKSFSDRRLFENVELKVTGGERIALIGNNGTGKSTLLNMIMGTEPVETGYIKTGPAVKSAYLQQQIDFPDKNRSALDTVIYETGCTPQTARNRLGAFKFSGEDAFKPVSAMSGGELSRLRLCILMMSSINFLILDEPTNHLDVMSREWMEEALEDYEEALLFVSHDRYFISRFATRIWELEGGSITDYPCGFEEYRRRKDRAAQAQRVQKENVRREKEKEVKKAVEELPDKKRAALEKKIQASESRLKELDTDIEAFSTDYEKLTELYNEKAAEEAQLADLYEQWYILTDSAAR